MSQEKKTGAGKVILITVLVFIVTLGLLAGLHELNDRYDVAHKLFGGLA